MRGSDFLFCVTRLLLAGVLVAWQLTGAVTTPHALATEPAAPSQRDYSFGSWRHGWRNPPGNKTPEVLCLETGHYGLLLDTSDIRHPRFGLLADQADYVEALQAGLKRVGDLPQAELAVDLTVDGQVYHAVSSPRQSTRLWESGRLCQHYELLNLTFQDEAGRTLPAFGSLDITAWPESITFNAACTPDSATVDGPSQGVVGNSHCIAKKPLDIPHNPKLEPEHLSVECWVNLPAALDIEPTFRGWLLCKNGREGTRGNYGFRFDNGRIAAVLNNAGGWQNVPTINERQPLTREQWHHLALTFDGKTMRFFVDGKEQGQQQIATARRPGKGVLRIGQAADGSDSLVRGRYDQIRIWNRALTAAELAAHAARPQDLPQREGLVYENNFDEGTPTPLPRWNDASLSLRFSGGDRSWQQDHKVAGEWNPGTWQRVCLSCDLPETKPAHRPLQARLTTPDGQTFPVAYDPAFNALVARVEGLKRPRTFTHSDYDEFDLVIACDDNSTQPVPLLIDFRGPARITGLVPLLCDADGAPTGIPVQTSKNWHHGSYLRASTLVPVTKGDNRYRLRIVYGYYGSLPSASHAQLSLIGWGRNQRWDQLALMCGGEMITFDVDMSATDVAVCDVRLPFGRNGKDGAPWGWTDAGWGGDWLGVSDAAGQKLTFTGMKAATVAHGPCLTNALYHGSYGTDRSVALDAHVQVPRTDDYGRTFQKLKYVFTQNISAADSYFLRRHARAFDGSIAYGNADGLLAEVPVTAATKPGDLLVPPTKFTGPGPWWIAFPKRSRRGKPDWGFGSVSLVIRDYQATFGGKDFPEPFVQARVTKVEDGEAMLETWLVPPPEVTAFQPGDRLTLDTEWVHLHRNADDYCGTNAAYRQHLEAHPQSWQTTWREVRENSPVIRVEGGSLKERLPAVIQVQQPTVTMHVTGGVGFLPVRFEGLKSSTSFTLTERINGADKPLDQAVHGQDFWQTDYDAKKGTYSISFNLPVDGKKTSTWVLNQPAK